MFWTLKTLFKWPSYGIYKIYFNTLKIFVLNLFYSFHVKKKISCNSLVKKDLKLLLKHPKKCFRSRIYSLWTIPIILNLKIVCYQTDPYRISRSWVGQVYMPITRACDRRTPTHNIQKLVRTIQVVFFIITARHIDPYRISRTCADKLTCTHLHATDKFYKYH